jgi:protein arginine kinase
MASELRAPLLAAVQARADHEGAHWVDVHEADGVLRLLLRERHLVSRDLAPVGEERSAPPGRAVAFDQAESVSIMVNEEDHLRIQTLESGLALERALERCGAAESQLESKVQVAFNESYGYLTCCPTNVGTGLRASVMMHLPALSLVRSELEKVFAAVGRTGLAVRGLYGEGSRAFGDYYQISNQVTLGRAEGQLVETLQEMVLSTVAFERSVRERLLAERRSALVDRVSRSLGLLRTARAMPTDAALAHLSNLRLGLCVGLLPGLSMEVLAKIRVQIQKGHIQALTQKEPSGEPMEASERDRLRAAFLRQTLAER